MDEYLDGQKITRMETIGSWYADGNIIVVDDEDNQYRMHVNSILQMVNDFIFTKKQARKHCYLVNPKAKENNK